MTDESAVPDEEDLLASALRRLAEVELQAVIENPGDADHGADAVVRVASPAGSRRYDVQVKARVSPSSAATIHRRGNRRPLIVSPYISDSVGELWRHEDVHYVDSVGNMYLRWPGLLVDVRGRRRPSTPPSAPLRRPLRAFQHSGLRVVFVLLAEPDAVRAPYRDIARHSAASLGTVQWVLKELEQSGYVHSGPRGRRLHRTRDLLGRWVEAYGLDLWPRLSLGYFDSPDPTWWREADEALRAENAQWGGETAAHRLDRHLLPGKAVVYAPTLPRRLILDRRFRKAGGEGNVEIRQRFWDLPQSDLLVPTPLIYADLVASAEPRQREAAARVREQDDLLRHLDRG